MARLKLPAQVVNNYYRLPLGFDEIRKKLNHCLFFVKYYLYCQKLTKKQIESDDFKHSMSVPGLNEGEV